MNNQQNPYEELFEHIKVFEERVALDDEDWDKFIGGIKKQVLLKQIASYKNN